MWYLKILQSGSRLNKKLRTFYYLIILLIVVSGCLSRGQDKGTIIKQNSCPVFFAVTGYGSADSTITLQDLIKKISSDSTNSFIFSGLKDLIDPFFNISVKSKTISNWDEVPASDSVLCITDIDHLLPEMRVLRINNIDFFEDAENYSLSIDKNAAKQKRDSITSMIISGTTAITRAEGMAADINGIDFIIKNLKPYFEKADFVHISNEVSFCENCQYVAGMQFCSKKEHFKALLDLHCNIVELTGNHNKDFGSKAFLETLKWYHDNNIKTFGGGAYPEEANTPLVITLKDSSKIGFIGFNEFCPNGECSDMAGQCGANRYDSAKAAAVIAKMKNELKCNYIIASVQFGECDSPQPTLTQQKKCDDLLKMGADMVYGSQAHEAQQVTFINHKPVFYGLGNLLFDQIHRLRVRQAFFLKLYFYKGKLVQAQPVFTFMQLNRQQHIASAEEAKEIRKEIFKNSLLYRNK